MVKPEGNPKKDEQQTKEQQAVFDQIEKELNPEDSAGNYDFTQLEEERKDIQEETKQYQKDEEQKNQTKEQQEQKSFAQQDLEKVANATGRTVDDEDVLKLNLALKYEAYQNMRQQFDSLVENYKKGNTDSNQNGLHISAMMQRGTLEKMAAAKRELEEAMYLYDKKFAKLDKKIASVDERKRTSEQEAQAQREAVRQQAYAGKSHLSSGDRDGKARTNNSWVRKVLAENQKIQAKNEKNQARLDELGKQHQTNREKEAEQLIKALDTIVEEVKNPGSEKDDKGNEVKDSSGHVIMKENLYQTYQLNKGAEPNLDERRQGFDGVGEHGFFKEGAGQNANNIDWQLHPHAPVEAKNEPGEDLEGVGQATQPDEPKQESESPAPVKPEEKQEPESEPEPEPKTEPEPNVGTEQSGELGSEEGKKQELGPYVGNTLAKVEPSVRELAHRKPKPVSIEKWQDPEKALAVPTEVELHVLEDEEDIEKEKHKVELGDTQLHETLEEIGREKREELQKIREDLEKLRPDLAELYARNRRLVVGSKNRENFEKIRGRYGELLDRYLKANAEAKYEEKQEELFQYLGDRIKELEESVKQDLRDFCGEGGPENTDKTQEEINAERERLIRGADEQLRAEYAAGIQRIAGEVNAQFTDDYLAQANELAKDTIEALDNGTIYRKFVSKVVDNPKVKTALIAAGVIGLAASGIGIAAGLATGGLAIGFSSVGAVAHGAVRGGLIATLMSRQSANKSAIQGFGNQELPETIQNLEIINQEGDTHAANVSGYLMQEYQKANKIDNKSNKKRSAVAAGIGTALGAIVGSLQVTTPTQVGPAKPPVPDASPASYDVDLSQVNIHRGSGMQEVFTDLGGDPSNYTQFEAIAHSVDAQYGMVSGSNGIVAGPNGAVGNFAHTYPGTIDTWPTAAREYITAVAQKAAAAGLIPAKVIGEQAINNSTTIGTLEYIPHAFYNFLTQATAAVGAGVIGRIVGDRGKKKENANQQPVEQIDQSQQLTVPLPGRERQNGGEDNESPWRDEEEVVAQQPDEQINQSQSSGEENNENISQGTTEILPRVTPEGVSLVSNVPSFEVPEQYQASYGELPAATEEEPEVAVENQEQPDVDVVGLARDFNNYGWSEADFNLMFGRAGVITDDEFASWWARLDPTTQNALMKSNTSGGVSDGKVTLVNGDRRENVDLRPTLRNWITRTQTNNQV